MIGCGKMATALIRGWLRAGLTQPERLIASDPMPSAREVLTRSTGVVTVADNRQVVEQSDVVVLAVKPDAIPDAIVSIRPSVTDRHLLISIAAGVTLEQLDRLFGEARRLIRVMPNTPCLVGESASAYCVGGAATDADAAIAERLFSAVGTAIAVPEKLMDAVTGLSGSGPAYVAVIIDALSDGGVRMGLPRDVATRLATQTVLGTARMIQETGRHPGEIKDAVTSPGGTTSAGLHALERGGLRAALIDAVVAASERARQLAHDPEDSPRRSG